jgi:hypothetical protein
MLDGPGGIVVVGCVLLSATTVEIGFEVDDSFDAVSLAPEHPARTPAKSRVITRHRTAKVYNGVDARTDEKISVAL